MRLSVRSATVLALVALLGIVLGMAGTVGVESPAETTIARGERTLGGFTLGLALLAVLVGARYATLRQ